MIHTALGHFVVVERSWWREMDVEWLLDCIVYRSSPNII